jgi:hypothetical protein
MQARRNRHGLGALFTAMSGIVLSLSELSAQPPPMPAQIPPMPPPSPKVSFVLKNRHGHATPARTDAAHSGGGNIDVAQPREDTLIVTMSGVVTAGPHPAKGSAAVMDFDLNQEFAVSFADPKLKKAKLIVEGQVVGLLRGDKHGGSASAGNGIAVIAGDVGSIMAITIEGHVVGGDSDLAINDHQGPVSVAVPAGDYHLLQSFRINAAHARSICGKAAAAEFAPDPALDPTWISVTDPFRGANKKEFGFRVILRVEPE